MIIWTNIRNNILSPVWSPNHFVLCTPSSAAIKDQVIGKRKFEDQKSLSFSMRKRRKQSTICRNTRPSSIHPGKNINTLRQNQTTSNCDIFVFLTIFFMRRWHSFLLCYLFSFYRFNVVMHAEFPSNMTIVDKSPC